MNQLTAPVLDPADIITPDELAARLKVKRGWVYNQLRPTQKNPLPAIRIGRQLRFSWKAVCAWMHAKGEVRSLDCGTF